jgi:hypothetical protein
MRQWRGPRTEYARGLIEEPPDDRADVPERSTLRRGVHAENSEVGINDVDAERTTIDKLKKHFLLLGDFLLGRFRVSHKMASLEPSQPRL